MSSIKLKSGTELPLMNLKGKDYLQVAYRLVWFRLEHPDWSIETEFVYQNEQSALCKATVKDARGRIYATSHKEESLKDFPAGFREKAETGAIGRALALIGYGTQYEPDFDEGERIVDSPVGVRGAVRPEQPHPDDGIQEDGVLIKYGVLAGQLTHNADPKKLRKYLLDEGKKWIRRGLDLPPPWAQPIVESAEALCVVTLAEIFNESVTS